MTRSLYAISLPLVLATGFAIQAGAKDKMPREARIDGRVQMINKDKSEITVRQSNSPRTIIYSGDTKWTKRNKEGSMADIKEGYRVICVGKMNDKAQLMASRCDARGN